LIGKGSITCALVRTKLNAGLMYEAKKKKAGANSHARILEVRVRVTLDDPYWDWSLAYF